MTSTPKTGALGILKVGVNTPLLQKIILTQDADDRGKNTGIRLLGLPGGGVEFGEQPMDSALRELEEEVGISPENISYFRLFGVYQKIRTNNQINDNHIFVGHCSPLLVDTLATNDPKEVSAVKVLTVQEILAFGLNYVHEGTLRIILNYLKNKRDGCLSNVTRFAQYQF
jgi:8-oxo-dGTP pyrophosphatase MutT (NUDIX family)